MKHSKIYNYAIINIGFSNLALSYVCTAGTAGRVCPITKTHSLGN